MDTGIYGNVQWAEIEEHVLRSIDQGFRTLGGIKRQAGIPAFRDISDVINALIAEKKIRKMENSTIAAYFRYDQMPTRFWLDGEGKVAAEFEEGFRPRDEEAKAMEMTGTAAFNAPISENSAKAVRPPKADPKVKGKANVPDPAVVEQLAKEGLSTRAAAERLGITDSAFKNYLTGQTGKNSGVREAWYRGKGGNPRPKRGAYKLAEKRSRVKPEDRKDVERATEVKAKPEPVKAVTEPEKAEITAKAWTMATPAVHSKHVTLTRGGQVLIAFEGNLFDLTPEELILINELGERMNKFENA